MGCGWQTTAAWVASEEPEFRRASSRPVEPLRKRERMAEEASGTDTGYNGAARKRLWGAGHTRPPSPATGAARTNGSSTASGLRLTPLEMPGLRVRPARLVDQASK